eukprot:s475_g36.t1
MHDCGVFQGGYLEGKVSFKNDPSLLPADEYPQLVPYRSLDASRLKLVGRGQWPMEDHIQRTLWLPFLEPSFLWHGMEVDETCGPNFSYESRSECLSLMKLWDRQGLLKLFTRPLADGLFSRVFNCFKSPEHDRQIGDRRRVNMAERSYDGPSKHLPPGPILLQLSCKKFKQKLVASVTDRRDFYHQAKVSQRRAQSNLLPFCFSAEELVGTKALEEVLQQPSGPRRRDREGFGDDLKGKRRLEQLEDEAAYYGGFASLFQGDHLGVEFALAAHQSLLEGAGLLCDGEQVRGHCLFPKGPIYSGLIIDDFFLISRERASQCNLNSSAAAALSQARAVYAREGLLGSDEKDVVAQTRFKAAGAEIVSDEDAVRRGFVTVGAPASKRLALSSLSLRIARLPGISAQLAARVAGNWNSVLMYRRCLCSVVDDLFALGSGAEEMKEGAVLPLTRSVAKELVMLSVLAPIMVSNVACDYLDFALASDASLLKGAVVKAPIDTSLSEELWLDTDKKGAHVLLDNGFRQSLRHLGEEPLLEDEPPAVLVRPKASPLLYFDFVEICGGVGAVTAAAADMGLSVAPPLDLSESVHYDLRGLRFLQWTIMMIEENRFRSFLIAPPCTTFSPAAYPNLRSYQQPYGYFREHPRVLHGNCLAFRSLVLLRVGKRANRPCGGEQPRRSKMRWLREWKSLVDVWGFEEAIIAACNFGSVHQKEFCFVIFKLSKEALQRKCTRDHSHVRIQGTHTKKSAAYTPELGSHLALEFKRALKREAILADEDFSCLGLESAVTNDFVQTSRWSVVRSWFWRRSRHINVLEVSSAIVGLEREASSYPSSRFVSLLDSSVARGALTKGRSSSKMLQPLLRKSAAIQIGFDLYPVFPFCPTRHNTADDPTRDCDIRQPVPNSIFGLGLFDSRILHRTGLRRFAANWVRLFLLVLQVSCLEAKHVGSESSFLHATTLSLIESCFLWILDFLHNLSAAALSGFWILSFIFILSTIIQRFKLVGLCGFFIISSWSPCTGFVSVASRGVCGAYAMVPGSALERKRAAERANIVLSGDRVALEVTRSRRKVLLKRFQSWLWNARGVSLLFLLREKPADPEQIAHWLVEFGKELYKSGKAYNSYAETINAVACSRPQIKKQLTQAWDYAFSWVAGEPFGHHPALPAGILVAMLSLALLWGWPQVAAVFGLAWAGVLRIGEVLQATRADLVLPGDAVAGPDFALLKIREPKTRGRHAKHQAARIDPVDIIQILELAYKNVAGSTPLWTQSSATLRKRLNDLMRALKLPRSLAFHKSHGDLFARNPAGREFFGGNGDAVHEDFLADKWLLWFLSEDAEPPSVTRLDFLVSWRNGGKPQVWTCEVGECGASLCSVECDARNCATLNWAVREDPSGRFPMALPKICRNSGWKS